MKNRYKINSSNRLIIARERKNLPADGKFAVDKSNRLSYWLNEPSAWKRQYGLPNKINFVGNWQLGKNHDLQINLTKGQGQLVLNGEIIGVDKDTFVFGIKGIDKNGQSHFQLLKLSGYWLADGQNRICFAVEKKISPDTLTLESTWRINKNQQIIYKYSKQKLTSKTKSINSLIFTGHWKIDQENRLTYILEGSAKSRFDFRAQLESPNLYPAEGIIKYRIGIGLRKNKSENKIISLFGAWKFSRRGALSFQMDYGKAKIESIDFGANIYLSNKDEVTLELSNKRKEPLGINITFNRKFLKKYGGMSFLKLKHSGKESAVEAGVRIPF